MSELTGAVTSRTLPWLVRGVGVVLIAALMTSATASYLVRAATAVTAAAVLLVAAHRHRDAMATPRRLFAAALLVGAVSGLTSAAYSVVTGRPSPTGWLADWIYLSYAPLAVAGTLLISRRSDRREGRLRALGDGAVAAGALWFLTVALLIEPRGVGDDLGSWARLATLAYPLVPAFVIAVMLSALPRVGSAARPFMLRASVGMALLGAGDVAFSVAAFGGWYQPTSWVAAVNLVGLLVLLEAAVLGARPALQAEDRPADADLAETRGLLVVIAPYAPLVLALVVGAAELASGVGITPAQLGPVLLVGVAVVVRHVASTRETSRLVERLARRERLAQRLACTDPLTGLANRVAFVDQLDAALRDPASHPVAVALLDLNDFKDLNDTHGHDTGDEVLRHTAGRLRQAVPIGLVARLGGDEFAAFVPASTDGGHQLGATVAAAFAEPVRVGSRRFSVRPSVGVVVDERPTGGARTGDASHLLAHADVAMYEAKGNKGKQVAPVAVLTGAARAGATATIRIREEVSTPDLAQFRVVYQPIVDLGSGEIVAAEALLRWWHPRFGEISPGTFIPLAERVGSVGALGDFVIDTALDDIAGWRATCGTPIPVGVNVSPRQLTDPGLVDSLISGAAARGLGKVPLALEVTEEALVDDIDAVAETVTALRAAGITVAVDDFGTGYSSLRYLRRFDANIVKIDQEFVQAAPLEPRTNALVASVVAMADVLDMTCIAEGIETLEQLALVRAHGCHYGQGYLIARPMPGDQLLALLVERHVYPVHVAAPELAAARDMAAVVPIRGRAT